MTALFWTAVIIGAALFAAVVIRETRDWEAPTPGQHSRDCRDLYGFGLTDPECPMPHGTTHFATPRDQVEFENSLDGQISIGDTK